jgi:hypothetical protein
MMVAHDNSLITPQDAGRGPPPGLYTGSGNPTLAMLTMHVRGGQYPFPTGRASCVSVYAVRQNMHHQQHHSVFDPSGSRSRNPRTFGKR